MEKDALINEIESVTTYLLSMLESSGVFTLEDKDYWFFYGIDKQLENINIDISAYRMSKVDS